MAIGELTILTSWPESRSEYAYAGRGDYGSTRPAPNEYEQDSFDDEDESVDGDVQPTPADDIASHYGNTDHYRLVRLSNNHFYFRETWRRVREADGVPGVVNVPSATASVVAESPGGSSDGNWPSQQAPALASGFSSFV